jgi:hypothetical protein
MSLRPVSQAAVAPIMVFMADIEVLLFAILGKVTNTATFPAKLADTFVISLLFA